MENRITNLKISNFKSIREAELECGRINLFVGRPNVGKSNVLEALALLGFYFSKGDKFMGDFIRYEEMFELFHWYNIKQDMFIQADTMSKSLNARISYIAEEDNFRYFSEYQYLDSLKKTPLPKLSDVTVKNPAMISPDGHVSFTPPPAYSPVKKYSFNDSVDISDRKFNFLTPPFGENLARILLTTPELKKEIPDLFKEYGLEFFLDPEKRSFYLVRKEQGILRNIPYHLIADTLQRIIFHYAAIFSNKDSVILFEEPESHSFPPYVSDLAYKISQDTANQYFITTHSPYLFTKIVEETPVEEVAVFITYFENYETKFKKLTAEDISELLDYGIDIFFNAKYFLDETVPENPS